MRFRLRGIDPAPFRHLYGAADEILAAAGAIRCRVDRCPGFPDRVELRDMTAGETALLVNYEHQSADTPYWARHAIFVREGAMVPTDVVDAVPEVLRRRTLSVRAFAPDGMMTDAALTDGGDLAATLDRLFADTGTVYCQVHYAARGCYAALATRD